MHTALKTIQRTLELASESFTDSDWEQFRKGKKVHDWTEMRKHDTRGDHRADKSETQNVIATSPFNDLRHVQSDNLFYILPVPSNFLVNSSVGATSSSAHYSNYFFHQSLVACL